MVHMVQNDSWSETVQSIQMVQNGHMDFLTRIFRKVLFLEHPVKELCSPEDCDRSAGGRWALERPLRLGLGLKGKLNIIRKKSKPLSIGYLLEMKESNFFSKIETKYTKKG